MRWIVDFSNRVILARCCFFEIWQSYVGKLGGESHESVEPNCKVTVVPRQKFAFWARFPRVTPTNLYLPSQLPTLWEPGLIFMQDDISIHTAHIIKNLACWNGNQSGGLAFLFSRSQSWLNMSGDILKNESMNTIPSSELLSARGDN